ncbi:YcgN family cysteine cluster protein [Pseudahrensia aquimaris]|uniref:UPF0260 protein ACFQ14_05600 n=1 Tax=Pseudahrensia aquimaris TaxID=744461 RepID=A0ABW3FBN7_9HYPH
MTVQKDKSGEVPFWKRKTLREMTLPEWESLCDGCGKCCLNKLEDWDTGEIHFTNVACTLFDDKTCRCKDYDDRFATVPDCIKLTPEDLHTYSWLPDTCAYRILDEGRELQHWHPLVSGDPQSVHKAGISVRGRTISEDGMTPEDWEDHLVDWLGEPVMRK